MPDAPAAPAAAPSPTAAALLADPTPGTPTAPADPAAPAATPAIPKEGTWFASLDADSQAWLEAGKFNVDDAAAAAQRLVAKARNAEKLVGLDKMPIPKEGDDEGYRNAMLRLGASKVIDDYKLPEGTPKDGIAAAFQKYANEVGMPVKQFEGSVKLVNEMAAAAVKAEEEAFVAKTQKETADTLAAWGAAKAEKIEAGRRFAREMKLDAKDDTGVSLLEKLERAWGSKQTLEFLASNGAHLMDEKFKGGEGGASSRFALSYTPEGARAAWDALGKDRDFMTKLRNNDPQAVERRDTLSAAMRGKTLDEYRSEIEEARSGLSPRRSA